VVASGSEGNVGERGQLLAETSAEIRVGVDASAYGGATLRQRMQSRLHGGKPLNSKLDLRAPSGELLAERHGHRIHQMRATGFHDRPDLTLFCSQHVNEMLQSRHELAAHA